MPTAATTVDQYLDALPPDRREIIEQIRKVILKNLPKGYAEGIQYGMIGYFVPHAIYPPGYHCDPAQPLPLAGIGNQKGHVSMYLFCLYTDPVGSEAFANAWKATGKKLDMGKSCVRIKRIEDVPLEVVGKTIASVPVKAFIAHYESMLESRGQARPAPKTTRKPANKPATNTKKASTKKPVSKAAAKKSTPSKKNETSR